MKIQHSLPSILRLIGLWFQIERKYFYLYKYFLPPFQSPTLNAWSFLSCNVNLAVYDFVWKSDLTDKMKHSFFQVVVMSILLYGCTTWTLTKRLEKKLDNNYTRMLRAILNKSWRKHPKSTNYTATYLPSRKLSKLDEPDMQDTAGETGTSS